MGSDSPGRKPTVSDEEILAVFEKAEDPVLMADEVAESLPIGRRAVYNRLRSLESEGFLRSKKTGARSTVWWYPGHTSTGKQR
jgi:Fe2+ or Zn2+ uptake regulation protein